MIFICAPAVLLRCHPPTAGMAFPVPDGKEMLIATQSRARISFETSPQACGGKCRRAEAERARVRLTAAVDALQDGLALYDAEDRLVLCNERYREIYPLSASSMQLGTSFADILRYGLAQGEYLGAKEREEEWLAERLAAHRQNENQMEQRLHDGRWLRVCDRSTPNGGRVGLRIVTTAPKEAEARALADRAAAIDAIAINAAECPWQSRSQHKPLGLPFTPR